MTLENAQELIALTTSVFQGLLAGLQDGSLDASRLSRARFAIEEAIRDDLLETVDQPSSTPHAASGIDLRVGCGDN